MADKFSKINLAPWLVRQCQSFGLVDPTPIQENCIPRILAGEDCIGCAKTGSGKTLAFALPVLQKLSEDPYGIFALVLTPTRELAFQIAEQFSVLGKAINLRHSVIIGGMDMVVQGQELSRRPHVVVATPGRLADHLESCDTFSFSKIKFLVLDEADRLLGGHFDDQIQTIFSALPKKRQTLLFSATMTDTLEQVRQVASNEVFLYEAPAETLTVDTLEQFYVLCPGHVKDGYLVELVRSYREAHPNGQIIIFTDTCRNCQLMSMTLNEVGFENGALHAMIKQRERLSSLSKFKSSVLKVLIATDVASRGLDIPAVELVINHAIPAVPKDYIHRVGRTARAGRGGTSVSLVTPSDVKRLHAIEELINTKLKEYSVDGPVQLKYTGSEGSSLSSMHKSLIDKEVVKILTQVKVTKREAEIKLDETDFYEKKIINKRKKLILEGKDPDEEEDIKALQRKIKRKQMSKKRKMIEEIA